MMTKAMRVLGAVLLAPALAAGQTAAGDFFESKVRPVLAGNCYGCHTDSAMSGLRVDSRESLLKGGRRGPAVTPGDPKASTLIQAVAHTHPHLRMPMGGRLASHEVEALMEWVRLGAPWPESPREFFAGKVKPVLNEKCLPCHLENPQGKLRMDSREALLAGGASGPAIVPGNPETSLLVQAIRYDHQKLRMPPAGKLDVEIVARIEKWISDGAVWDDPVDEKVPEFQITAEQRNHWSFQPVKKPSPPEPRNAQWARNAIDRFVLARLEAKGLAPGKPADRRTLIRRVAYDLTGLPPDPALLASEEPWERLVDRLLASRAYAERWGRHWLDLVRYADTAGDAADYPVPEAYQYRNYVIDAFAQDKPYDEFIREQIAGDLLPYNNDDQRWEQTIATGYLAVSRRIGVTPETLRHITLEDTIDNVGKTFLALSVQCARCHDHKFDPIPTADYYAIYGILDSSVFPHAGAEHKPYREDFVYRVGTERAAEIWKPYWEAFEPWRKKERAKFREYQEFQNRKIEDPTRTREIVWKELLDVREQMRPHAEAFPPLETAYAIQEGKPQDAHIQRAGEPRAKGPKVRRGFLQILGGQKLPEDAAGSGRRELAGWISDPNNPLTARVLVNRVWHYHFGQGLVRTTSDFGLRGTPPTHPELLDYLASWFMDNGWSVKKLHRLILSSAAYQLAASDIPANSAADPDNQLLWRANRRRLDAEQIRDSILKFSGSLDVTPGARHPFPHHLTYFYRQHEPFNELFPTRRRSVYMMQQRFEKNAYLDLFDGPDGNLPLSERRSTTTSPQALFFMNSEFLHRESAAIAERLMARSAAVEGRVSEAYRMIFHRDPAPEEAARAGELLAAARSQTAREDQAWAAYIRAMLSSNEFLYVD